MLSLLMLCCLLLGCRAEWLPSVSVTDLLAGTTGQAAAHLARTGIAVTGSVLHCMYNQYVVQYSIYCRRLVSASLGGRIKASLWNLLNKYQRQRGLWIQIVLLLLSCCCCLALSRVSKGEQRRLTDSISVIYFRNLLSNWDSGEKVLKSFKEVGLDKFEKKLHPYFS